MKKLITRFLIVFVVFMTIFVGLVAKEYEFILSVTEKIRSLGIFAPVIFLLIYALSPALFVPISPLAIIGGFIFGPMWGMVYSVIGASLAAAIAFLAGRYFAHDWAEKNVKGILGQIKDGIEEEGWQFIAFSRLVPIFPYNIINFAYGLTKIPFRIYLTATFFAIMPGAFAYSYVGYVGKEALTGASGLVLKSSLGLGILLFITMLAKIVRKRKNKQLVQATK